MARVAAIDCGTNSIRLLIAESAASGLQDVVRRMEVVRLGQGVDRTGRIAADRMAAALAMCQTYAAQCREHDATRVRFVATSASRDADNTTDFVAGVEAAFAASAFTVAPEVISGAEEARLSFLGATGDVRAAGLPGPYLVVDIGGGSTELVRGEDSVTASTSVDIGCVRLTERHLLDDPPTATQIAAAEADIARALDAAEVAVPLDGIAALIGLAGTVTTITAHVLGLPGYQAARIHLARCRPEPVVTACTDLIRASRAERATLPFMHPGRVDVIGGGALVWRAIVRRVTAAAGEVPVVTSEHDILDGIALSLLEQ